MKPRFIFWTLSLVVVLLTVSCAPAVTSPPAAPTDIAIPATAAPADTSAPAATASAPTQSAEVEVQAVATSRGPNLEATDPATVSLASGQLQLVEFFRFTWSTCRAMAPMVHGLEAEYSGKIKFSYLDADDPNTDTFQRTLGFAYQPELYLLDANGKVLKKFIGFTSQEDLKTEFAKYIQ
jgi:thioredoxin-like negative regulator of GroEL